METLSGSCHCGKVSFEVEGTPEKVYECNCSHCSRKGYLLWFVPREKLQLKTPEAEFATYHFNKHVIAHHFCPNCGCAPFGVSFPVKATVQNQSFWRVERIRSA